MRRLLAIALLAALPAAAQIHGVPPSVTSITPGRNAPGVPASVTSLGPNGFGNSCCGANFSNGFFFDGHFHHHHFHHHHFVPFFVPYYYPYYPAYPATYTTQPAYADDEVTDEEQPARTIYERRSRTEYSTDEDRYGEHYTDSRENERRRRREQEVRAAEEQREREKRAEEEKSKSKEKAEDQEPAIVLVFKDGHHQDVGGYAISGEILYDLGHGRAKKIQLAELDLPATIKLNDQLGNDFRLPSRPAKQN